MTPCGPDHTDPITGHTRWSYGLRERTCRRCGLRQSDTDPLTTADRVAIARALGVRLLPGQSVRIVR